MPFYMATNSILGFDALYGGVPGVITTANRYNTTYVDCAMQLGFNQAWSKTIDTPLSDIWVHFDVYYNSAVNAYTLPALTLYNSASAQGLFRIKGASFGLNLILQYWDGAVWQDFSGGYTFTASTRFTVDLHIKIADSGGIADMYIDGSAAIANTGDTKFTAFTTVDRIEWSSPYNGAVDHAHSQMMVADESTIGCFFYSHVAGSNGDTYSGWTGSYASFDLLTTTVYPDDTTLTESAAANDIALVNFDSLPGTSLYMRGLVQNIHARRGETGPANINFCCKSNGVTYHSYDYALRLGYTGLTKIWRTDPDTSADFLTAAITAAQVGFRSRT